MKRGNGKKEETGKGGMENKEKVEKSDPWIRGSGERGTGKRERERERERERGNGETRKDIPFYEEKHAFSCS